MSLIRKAFERAASEGRAAFIPYITVGDPDLEATGLYVRSFIEAGADLIELGVPFSDPVADGPTNQAAATRALASGTTLERVLGFVSLLRKEKLPIPIVLFTYFNPIFKMGVETFAEKASAAGVSGVLVVDLPPEEAEKKYLAVVRGRGLDTVFLSSPTTANDRLPLIDRASSGFVYYASRTGVTGITGVSGRLTETVSQELDRVKTLVANPVAVGFGIGTPEQVRALAPHADGIVVGSAFVKIIENQRSQAEGAKELFALAQAMIRELSKRGSDT